MSVPRRTPPSSSSLVPARIRRTSSKSASKTRRVPAAALRCVYDGHATAVRDCSMEKRFLSELKRHHACHRLYYCARCFNLFNEEQEMREHTGHSTCQAICVTRHCRHYGWPIVLSECNTHGGNSMYSLWAHLFCMARPGDSLPAWVQAELAIQPKVETVGSSWLQNAGLLQSIDGKDDASDLLSDGSTAESMTSVGSIAHLVLQALC